MRAFAHFPFVCAALLSVMPAALAQGTAYSGNTAQPYTTQGSGTPRLALPSPDVPDNSKPSDFLRAAQSALAANHAREAEEALERAQTRMLDRSVPLGETGNPSDNPTAVQIAQARQALTAHDRATCMNLLQQALSTATAQGL